jgi:hypothetical protein
MPDRGGKIAVKEMKSANTNSKQQKPFDELKPGNQENRAIRGWLRFGLGLAHTHHPRVRIVLIRRPTPFLYVTL